MLIREYRHADHVDIERLSREVIAEGSVFPFELVDDVLDYWFARNAKIFVTEIANRVVGTYVLKPNYPGRCSHVANAGYMVESQSRGQGVGMAMGRHSLVKASEYGFRSMQFNIVVATNEAAVKLWTRLEFELIGRVPDAFRHDDRGLVDLLIMHRPLVAQR